jgi:hypothetical protein
VDLCSKAKFTWIPQEFLHQHGREPDAVLHTFAGNSDKRFATQAKLFESTIEFDEIHSSSSIDGPALRASKMCPLIPSAISASTKCII